MVFVRLLFAVSITLLAALAATQGGAPGGGFGGGGGFQGGRADFSSDSEVVDRQLFLSPGDRTEWTFEAKENEAILVRITSNVFDPAVAIHDEKGTKLAENDDMEPGNQMAQLIYKLPKAGTYKAVVTNYKGTAGGQFNFHARRFLALDLKMNEARTVMVGERRAWAKVQIDKAGDYVLTTRTDSGAQVPEIFRPNGEEVHTVRQFEYGLYQRQRFTVTEPGAYFVRVPSGSNPRVKVAPVAQHEIRIGTSSTQAVSEDEFDDWTVAAKRGNLLEIALEGDLPAMVLEVSTRSDRPDNRPSIVMLRYQAQVKKATIAVLEDTSVKLSVRTLNGEPKPYEIRASAAGQAWPAGSQITSSLAWHENELWTLSAKTGDVLTVRATSPTYHTQLFVVDPNGILHSAVPQGESPDVAVTMPVRTPGRYVVMIYGGGIGEYRASREIVEPRRISEGTSTGEVKAGTPDVWRLTGRAGQDLVLRITSDKLRSMVSVVGPDGATVASINPQMGENRDFLRLKLPANGDYSIVVASADGSTGSYTLKLVDLDK